MKLNKFRIALVLISLTNIAAAQSNNQVDQNEPGVGGERPHGPPPQAIAACKGLADGATCSFVGRNNKALTGTCSTPAGGHGQFEGKVPPSGKQHAKPLACRPEHGAQTYGTSAN